MTILEHFENGKLEFKSSADFIEYVQLLFKENEEDNEVGLVMPRTYNECVLYVYAYCGNFEVIQSQANMLPY
jgi:hypothetical protein